MATVSLWGVQVGEMGNLNFVVRFDSAAKLGQAIEAHNNDPSMREPAYTDGFASRPPDRRRIR